METQPQDSQPPLPPEAETQPPVDPNKSVASNPPAGAPQKIHHKILAYKLILLSLVLIVLAIGSGAAYWFGIRQTGNKSDSQQTITTSGEKKTESNDVSLQPPAPVDGSTYLDSVKALNNLNFFKSFTSFGQYCDPSVKDRCAEVPLKASDIKYYQIGTTKDGQMIIVFSTPKFTIDSNIYYALGNSDGKYKILTSLNNNLIDSKSLSSNVTLDDKTTLKQIAFPEQITVSGQKLKISYDNQAFYSAGVILSGLKSIRGEDSDNTNTKIGNAGGFSFYEVVLDDQSTFKVVEIYATYKNLFSFPYKLNGEVAGSNSKLAIKWSSGENNQSIYYSAGKSCGTASGYLIAKNINKSDLKNVGKTPQGQTVYQLPTTNPLVQKIYNEDYSKGDYLDNAALKNLTVQQITDKHAYFLAQNGLNEYVVFESTDILPGFGGCAKPVIYLYPQKTETVSVKVGANITKSLPQYENGWQQVTAQPNGTLSYQNSTYPYLFWEGYGQGKYPDINSGTIVKKSEAITVIKAQLTQQGLHTQEINDFMDYWQNKIALINKPYIRLSWLGTDQMNQLAPLSISPAPQTTIRIFLDFEGLDKTYALSPQKLTSQPRNGFTVVEWGGYLRGSLN